ncbi:MAG: response regulator, partial [Candidatus Eisenbacteria bacterium]|nr:response regulator [Candidatus Eisenbacteria bacterium]
NLPEVRKEEGRMTAAVRDGSHAPRIVLAEDDPTNQFVIRAILAGAGFDVEVCENGRVALDAIYRTRPDVILLDLMMPIMDGYEAARTLASDPALDGVPIIAVTARVLHGDDEKALDAGCDAYIPKPISRVKLIQAVNDWRARPATDWMPDRIRKRDGFRRSA